MKVNRLTITNEKELILTRDKMYLASKEGKHFFGLTELMKNKQVILTAIHNIKSNKGSETAGVDGDTIDHFLQMEESELLNMIHSSVENYNPTPVRRVYIPKSNGKQRPLGIPTMLDRIIQELARMVLEPIAEAKFYDHSYGFRPYRSAEHALARVRDLVWKSKTYFAIEGDIKSFFDNVNHNRLVEVLWSIGLRDKRFLAIIKKMLKAGYMEKGLEFDTEVGTPQGGIISPLLANIYLNSFDWMIAKEYQFHPHTKRYTRRDSGYSRLIKRGHTPTFLVRYADDWVIMTRTKENAERLLTKVDKYFTNKLKIELSEEKTVITDLRERPIRFLGYCIRAGKPRNEDKITGLLYPDMKKVGESVMKVKKELTRLRYSPNMDWAVINLERINSQIVGIANYYNKGISKRTLNKIDNRLIWTAANSLKWLYGYKTITPVFAEKHYESMGTFSNRRNRHEGYTYKSFFIDYGELRVGLTKAVITPVQYSRNFNPKMTPYTEEGRKLRAKSLEKQPLKARPAIYHEENLIHYVNGSKAKLYNFEFMMNRDYAFNRDKGKCRACTTFLYGGNPHCHHKNNSLPLNKVNKVNNLITLCNKCHELVHSQKEVQLNSKGTKLILTLREASDNKS
ncbi:group II intron reverse transcriptase/maturase [Cytobacillus oceanisediminis]|uniref:group II intron reverse transcriptase/maturase n=1 Tax=Cytobacillus oceanisediminis TaxID=665099 RepID=UPI001CF368D5|nr:group II intron reverse transcriptase/maturase [Cytobacillus oceanisediminis]